MNRPIVCRTTLALLLAGAVCQAQASSTFRCGSGLVSLGDAAAEVAYKCGEPTDRSFQGYKEVLDDYGFRQEVGVEEWTYGPTNGMYHYLRFEGNRLRRIDSARGR